jgi:AcrR family transcriptional regulator
MARRRHSRDELLSAAVEVTMREGLGRLTFATVAQQAGVPDRTVVYYFPAKIDLVTAVVEFTSEQIMAGLQVGLGDRRRTASELTEVIWPVVTGPQARPLVQVWLEVCVRAAAGEQPHLDAARRLADTWLAWLGDRVEAPTDAERGLVAARVLALVDGALLLHHIGLETAAGSALAGGPDVT